MNKNYIGENIRIYRERKDITQRELADMIGKTWEMISRYERGISSPLNQLDSLADALEIESVDLLKDPTSNISSTYSFNKVPLFVSLPKDMDFKNTKSYIYYVAPDWILDIDMECFVVDSSIVEMENRNGYLYVSPNSVIGNDDLVLREIEGKLVVEKADVRNNQDVLGKVLAQEIRF